LLVALGALSILGLVGGLADWGLGPAHRSQNTGVLDIVTQIAFDINAIFDETGNSMVRYMYDVDGDGKKELVCNVGGQSLFAAIGSDMTIVWQNTLNTTQHKGAYYPKVHDGVLYYGDRSNDTVYPSVLV